MAKFALELREALLERVRVTTINARRQRVAAELILTDRRIVLNVETSDHGWAASFGLLGGLLAGLFTQDGLQKLTHEIRRDELAAVEVSGKRALRVTSKGEGYAKVWFDVEVKAPEALADRLRAWADARGVVVGPPGALPGGERLGP